MKTNFQIALRHTLPVLAGFFPLGLAYGILMAKAGYHFLWSGLTSPAVLAGSLQFLMLDFFAGKTPLVSVAVMSLLLNSRHIFYGLSFLERFREYGRKKYFMIYSLTDENYSLLCAPVPAADRKTVDLLSSLLVACYWVGFSMLGGWIGQWLPFDTTGIDFALTALFVVILVDQLRDAKSLVPLAAAVVSGIGCLLWLGPADFILPSLCITVAALLLLRPRLEPSLSGKEER